MATDLNRFGDPVSEFFQKIKEEIGDFEVHRSQMTDLVELYFDDGKCVYFSGMELAMIDAFSVKDVRQRMK